MNISSIPPSLTLDQNYTDSLKSPGESQVLHVEDMPSHLFLTYKSCHPLRSSVSGISYTKLSDSALTYYRSHLYFTHHGYLPLPVLYIHITVIYVFVFTFLLVMTNFMFASSLSTHGKLSTNISLNESPLLLVY